MAFVSESCAGGFDLTQSPFYLEWLRQQVSALVEDRIITVGLGTSANIAGLSQLEPPYQIVKCFIPETLKIKASAKIDQLVKKKIFTEIGIPQVFSFEMKMYSEARKTLVTCISTPQDLPFSFQPLQDQESLQASRLKLEEALDKRAFSTEACLLNHLSPELRHFEKELNALRIFGYDKEEQQHIDDLVKNEILKKTVFADVYSLGRVLVVCTPLSKEHPFDFNPYQNLSFYHKLCPHTHKFDQELNVIGKSTFGKCGFVVKPGSSSEIPELASGNKMRLLICYLFEDEKGLGEEQMEAFVKKGVLQKTNRKNYYRYMGSLVACVPSPGNPLNFDPEENFDKALEPRKKLQEYIWDEKKYKYITGFALGGAENSAKPVFKSYKDFPCVELFLDRNKKELARKEVEELVRDGIIQTTNLDDIYSYEGTLVTLRDSPELVFE